VKDAGQELRRILDRRDRKLARYMKVITHGFEPNPDGSVVFSSRTFKAIGQIRKRYVDLRQEIADVKGGGKAQQGLLSAFSRVDSGWEDFVKAAGIGYSYEQADAIRDASKTVQAAAADVKRIREGLGK
jgi:hypothetical protein